MYLKRIPKRYTKFAAVLLESIEAFNFRNLKGKFALGDGLTILSGENGQGKTNWLEAIRVLASARSFRTAKLQEAIAFGEKHHLHVCVNLHRAPGFCINPPEEPSNLWADEEPLRCRLPE